jgi:amidophosphoribosyltransferase
MLQEAGAKEIHVRISSPQTTHPCYYGIDTPTRQELVASTHTLEQIKNYITADSLEYLSLEGLCSAVAGDHGKFCYACFNGNYPVDFPSEEITQMRLFDPKPASRVYRVSR